ncbi:hypothetical protein C8J56DRAFT_907139 [Mycena floridula]|nr:hypothetical protein C8J56DRAFT_907139 [Mycena floridula]
MVIRSSSGSMVKVKQFNSSHRSEQKLHETEVRASEEGKRGIDLQAFAKHWNESANGKDQFCATTEVLAIYAKSWEKSSNVHASEELIVPQLNTIIQEARRAFSAPNQPFPYMTDHPINLQPSHGVLDLFESNVPPESSISMDISPSNFLTSWPDSEDVNKARCQILIRRIGWINCLPQNGFMFKIQSAREEGRDAIDPKTPSISVGKPAGDLSLYCGKEEFGLTDSRGFIRIWDSYSDGWDSYWDGWDSYSDDWDLFGWLGLLFTTCPYSGDDSGNRSPKSLPPIVLMSSSRIVESLS